MTYGRCRDDVLRRIRGDYHLAYGGRWDEAVSRQGTCLDELIAKLHPAALDVLDAACGIGTQAIGLSLRGYRVHGTDVSSNAAARARSEAVRLGASATFDVADFRDLSGIPSTYDVVISCDNALPHLLNHHDLLTALHQMRLRLRRDGLLVVTMRDFDAALATKPHATLPIVVEGPPRTVLVRLHEWDEDQPCYTLRYLVSKQQQDRSWSTVEHTSRYRAITRAELAEAATTAGFKEVRWWPDGSIVGGQLVFTARNVGDGATQTPY